MNKSSKIENKIYFGGWRRHTKSYIYIKTDVIGSDRKVSKIHDTRQIHNVFMSSIMNDAYVCDYKNSEIFF